MRAVITVIGKDMVGIFWQGFGGLREKKNVNVTEVTQSILQDLFAMIMLVDWKKPQFPLTSWSIR